jgi:hypothetical protein
MVVERVNAVHRDVRSRDVVANIVALHFPEVAIADLTWGKGAFWYKGSDVLGLDRNPRYGCQIAADSRHVPLADGSVDVAIFDPPHQCGISKTTTLNQQADFDRLPTQKDIHRLLAETAPELRRIARIGAIIKLTDMVDWSRFMPTHILFTAAAAPILGWPCDLAILDSGVIRPVRHQQVRHLRHAHSYFLIYKWAEKAHKTLLHEVLGA